MKLDKVTVEPRYSPGNIVEIDSGQLGRISYVRAVTTWTTEGPVTSIEYSLYQGKTYTGSFMEERIKRVVSES